MATKCHHNKILKAITASHKAITANHKATTVNHKATTASHKATTVNHKAITAMDLNNPTALKEDMAMEVRRRQTRTAMVHNSLITLMPITQNLVLRVL